MRCCVTSIQKSGDARRKAASCGAFDGDPSNQSTACDVLQLDRSSVRYQSRRGDDAELRNAIKRVSRERRRFGYRRIHVMIAREGFEVKYYLAVHAYMHERAQKAEAYLYRGEVTGVPQRWPEARFGHAQANGAAVCM